MDRYGHNGKTLRVDLSTRTMSEEELPEVLLRRYLGGGALSLYYLLKELKPGADPLGPDNLLIFAASAVTGHPAAGFSRFTVAAKSPLTGAFGESAYAAIYRKLESLPDGQLSRIRNLSKKSTKSRKKKSA